MKIPTDYLASIGRRGGKAGRGKAKARTSAQARKAAKLGWLRRRLEKYAQKH